jgi:serine/alanine adding enzyme
MPPHLTSERVEARGKLEIAAHPRPPVGWDEFVARSPEATPYHHSAWAGIMSDVLGHECIYLTAQDEHLGLIGVLPLVRVRRRPFGHFLLSMPFLNAGGPVGTPDAVVGLVTMARDTAARLGVDLLELRTRSRVPTPLTVSSRKITLLLELPDSAPALLQAFHPNTRRNIKKSMREGVEIKFGPEQVEPFYEVFARNMRDLGTPVLPKAFFERIARDLPDVAVFAAAYLNGRAVAGQCSLEWGDELEMVWGSSLREFNRRKPMTLVHWLFMERAIRRGLRTFNFGRCTPGSGSHVFKQQWGGSDVELPWQHWSNDARAQTPSPDGSSTYRLAVSAWQHLPLFIANRLGPVIAKGLP